MGSLYWQHADPLLCPKRHKMIWLGSVFWICGKGKCNTIYVEENRLMTNEENELSATTSNQPALQPPERIRILIREGRFANEWYYPDAAVMPYDAEFEYARVVDGGVATVDHEALIQLLDGALLHPERAEGYIRQVIEMLATTAPIAAPVENLNQND